MFWRWVDYIHVCCLGLALACALCASEGWSATVQVKTTSEDYLSCASSSKKDPEKALILADAWVKKNPQDLSALHCKSISLFALKRYAQAAKSLDSMWSVLKDSDAYTLQLNVLRQTAKALNLAGNREEAMRRYALALAIMARDDGGDASYAKNAAVEILLDRANMYLASGDGLSALQDMDYAVSYGVMAERVLVLRAKIYMFLDQLDLAKVDLNAALAQNPSSIEAQEMLRIVNK